MKNILTTITLSLAMILLLVTLGNGAKAQTPEKTKVAVVKPINKNNVNDFFVGLVKNNLEEFISYSSEYKAFTREAIDNILKEQTFQQSGLVNDEQLKQIGALGGVDMLCISEVSQFGEGTAKYMTVNAKLIDVETGEVGEVKNAYFKLNMDQLPNHIRDLAGKLTGTSIDNNSGVVTPHNNNKSSIGVNRTFTVNGVTFEMIYVEGGSFTMGCTSEQSDCEDDEKPAHRVTLDSYYMGRLEVTQALWQAVMGTSIYTQRDKANSEWSLCGVGSNNPMYYINYSECEEFCGKLNNLLRDQLPAGYRFRIPTEAQWEYAARGGVKAKSTVYSGSDYLSEVAWYGDNSGEETKEVGLKEPNELGIYDMSGNVWEWCYDWYSSSYYANSPENNPKNMSSGSYRVLRGGSWRSGAGNCRVSNRFNNALGSRNNYNGFRLGLVQ